MSTIPVWTNDRLSDLRKWAAHPDKLSAREIAAHFGCSRNAIIGACRRNGIPLHGPISSGRPKHPKQKRKARSHGLVKPRFKAEPFESASAPVDPLNIPFADLEPQHCRYPYGDGPFLFCGHPIEGEGSYCAGHHRLCWHRPDPERRRKNDRAYLGRAA